MSKWENNYIQFPRLLAEIRAVGLTPEQYTNLEDSMNLSIEQIDKLLERAESYWQLAKQIHCHKSIEEGCPI
jgi:hypothetical protein